VLFILFNESPVMLGLRHYKQEGPFFIIKMRRSTGDMISYHRVDKLPANWSESFIVEMKEIADRFYVNSDRRIN
jgi:hypothetical protein